MLEVTPVPSAEEFAAIVAALEVISAQSGTAPEKPSQWHAAARDLRAEDVELP
ncbi:MAG TPA: hypothetical protein VKG44_07305 [Candidatus Baltobacteraceae bacterium]|nr:hypothetical protein [Candidatus Baltobacteraceae bacterium]